MVELGIKLVDPSPHTSCTCCVQVTVWFFPSRWGLYGGTWPVKVAAVNSFGAGSKSAEFIFVAPP